MATNIRQKNRKALQDAKDALTYAASVLISIDEQYTEYFPDWANPIEQSIKGLSAISGLITSMLSKI